MSSFRRRVAGLVTALAGCGVAAVACGTPDAAVDRTEGTGELRGLALERPFAAPAFALTDARGRVYDFRTETAGSLTLLFFGYTHCPDICPVQMAVLSAALDDLPYSDRRAIKVVFVTTDPERDTPERLRNWLDLFDASFIGLRGEMATVNEIQAGFHLPPAMIEAQSHPAAGGGAYFVGHATPVVAITGDGIARALYPSGVRQTDWRHDLPLLLSLNRAVSQQAGGPGAGGG